VDDFIADFNLVIGDTCTVDNPQKLFSEIEKYRAKHPKKSRLPLSFLEFSQLLTSGKYTKPPQINDEFLYRNDAELSKTDAEIRFFNPLIAPADFRRLRRGFLYSRAKEQAIQRIQYEQEILAHTRKFLQDRTAIYSDYVAYLAAFHTDDLEAFFRPWALPVSSQDLKAHAYIAAGSGHGKSELIKVMLYGLLKARQGAILFDPHGDIAEQVVRWKEFSKHPERLIYFSPYLAGDSLDRVPVINPLSPLHNATDLDSAVENFIGVIAAVVGGDFEMSTRMITILKPCLYTLAQYPETTIYDIIDFLAEDPKPNKQGEPTQETPWFDRAQKTLKNRALQDILRTYFDKTYDTTKTAIRDRLRGFLSSHALDACLAGESTIDLARAMDEGRFIVFNLSHGKLGAETCATFGRFLLAALQNSAMRRQEKHAHQRRPVYTFIDEADRFISTSVMSIYKETRKYGLHLALAQQITGGSMTTEIKRAVFGNSNVRIGGAGGADLETNRDIAMMTGIDRAEIERLPRRVFYAKRGANDAVRFTVPDTLVGNKNAMSTEEWQALKTYQLDRYYRERDGSTVHPHKNAHKNTIDTDRTDGVPPTPIFFN
jgi:hypothetical protein